MKVLSMQLNSITIMDLIAYGGAAAGIITAVTQFAAGRVSLAGCLLIILLSADFFIPMRQLGSFFHVAMNGMAASEKIFRLLDLPEEEMKTEKVPEDVSVTVSGLRYSYDEEREILEGDRSEGSGGFVRIDRRGERMRQIDDRRDPDRPEQKATQAPSASEAPSCPRSRKRTCLKISATSHQSCLFKGTVRDNLQMGKPDAADDEMWDVLERTNMRASCARKTVCLQSWRNGHPTCPAVSASVSRLPGRCSTIRRFTSLTKRHRISMRKAKMRLWTKSGGSRAGRQ